VKKHEHILLAHGSGGRMTSELVESVFLPALRNPYLAPLSDSAVLEELPPGRPALTTDAFVVDPLVFAGGNLGKLAVCGTVNDLAMAGARPAWLTLAVILEEGLETGTLETLVESAAAAAREAGVQLVAGDTKVVPRGKGDGAFAVTSGLGVVPPGRELVDGRIRPGDAILVSGSLGDHGATILAARHGLESATLRSDCAPLGGLVERVLASGAAVRSMHDPTRGGLATVCNEVAGRSGTRLVLDEESVPVRPEVRATCELLGLDPLYLACEGRVVLWVAAEDAERALEAMRDHPLGAGAVRIGTVEASTNGYAPVVMHTRSGGDRPIDVLSGLDLPRIC